MEVSKGAWDRIFECDKDGAAILEKLAAMFYDRISYVKGDAYDTAFREGQRSVIQQIIYEIANDKQKEPDPDE